MLKKSWNCAFICWRKNQNAKFWRLQISLGWSDEKTDVNLKSFLGINECKENRHDCSPNADCIDTAESFMCKCRDDFVDESPDSRNRPGRICRPALVDECRLGKHDCHPNAICQDLAQGYTCHCKPEFIDQSPNRVSLPGRICAPRPTPPPEECRVDSLTSCKQELNEVRKLFHVYFSSLLAFFLHFPITQSLRKLSQIME